ncbi:hypothetical protein LE181_05000 [Streptomyces sp. SCA3-4]|uniref:hypothetical protein n=1 Tax=Streptomyces sichuanensis TaxID=2871810 RepID=UPI001CE3644F|nr:hypothetical protein [Streptomyces sichuanensis]MCA6091524.1 hypothetical protein [Streptomyces sichuanensis]
MARNGTGPGFTWFMLVIAGGLTVTLVVDHWVVGEDFDWGKAALLCILWPEALAGLLRRRGRRRAAARVDAAGRWSPFPATAVLWTGLLLGWSRGEGTDWWVFAGALLLPAAGILKLAASLAGRRTRRA